MNDCEVQGTYRTHTYMKTFCGHVKFVAQAIICLRVFRIEICYESLMASSLKVDFNVNFYGLDHPIQGISTFPMVSYIHDLRSKVLDVLPCFRAVTHSWVTCSYNQYVQRITSRLC